MMKFSESPALCRNADGSVWWLVENEECDRCFGIPVHFGFHSIGTATTHEERECSECEALGAHVRTEEVSISRVKVLLRKADVGSSS